MDRTRAGELAEDIVAALQPLAAELGLQIRARGGRFTRTSAAIKLECAELSDGVAQTQERDDFKAMCHAYGLKPEDLDAAFITDAEGEFRITGLAPSRRRYPVIAVRVPDGKAFKFGAETVVRGLARKRAGA